MKRSITSALWLTGGLALGAGLLWYSLRSVSLIGVLGLVREAQASYMLFAVALSLAFVAVKTQRWVILLRPVRPLTFSELHSPVYAGSAANLALSHAGELVRARMIDRRRGLSASTVLASIGLERVLDMLAMLVLLGYLFIAGGGHLTDSLAAAARVAAGLSFVTATMVLSVVLWPDRWAGLIARATAWAPAGSRAWIARHFNAAVEGLNTIKSPARVLQLVAMSLLQWSTIAASIWCCMRSVGIVPEATAPVAVLVLLVIGLTLPTAPAYLGTTQLAFTAALGVFGVMEDAAFAASALYTACVVMPVFLIGAGCLLRYLAPGASRNLVPAQPGEPRPTALHR